MLADLGCATFIVALGAGSIGVVPLKPGTLRGVGTAIAGGGVGARIDHVIPDGGLSESGHKIGTNQPIISRFSGGATGGDVDGTGSSRISAAGPVSSTAIVVGFLSNSVTCSKLYVCKLLTADVCPTDFPVVLETSESLSEVSSAMSITVGGTVAMGLTIGILWN